MQETEYLVDDYNQGCAFDYQGNKSMFFFFQEEDGIRDCSRDWSSDVCSSDLTPPTRPPRYANGAEQYRPLSPSYRTSSARRSSSRTTPAFRSRSSPSGSACRWERSRAACSDRKSVV